jgi:AbrB family looped-hinge helix DNA binding protein
MRNKKKRSFAEELPVESVRVLAKGQIVIPATLRKKYGLEPGADLGIFEYGVQAGRILGNDSMNTVIALALYLPAILSAIFSATAWRARM